MKEWNTILSNKLILLEDKLKNNVTQIIIAVICYLFTYGLIINSLIINNDSIRRLEGAEPSRIPQGRFLVNLYYNIVHNNTITPIITHVLACLFLIIASYYIIKLLKVKYNIQKVLIYIAVITYPLFNFFYAYGEDFDMYALAFLCAVLSVYFIFKDDFKHTLFAVLLIIVSLSFYQSFLVVITGLYILKSIILILELEEVDILKIFKHICIMCLSLILYFIIAMIVIKVTGRHLTGYRGADDVSIINTIINIPKNIILSYKEFFEIIFTKSFLFNTAYDYITLNIIIILIYVLAVLTYIVNKRKNLPLLFLLLIIFIPALYSINFIVNAYYDYIEFGFLIFFIGGIYLLGKIKYKKIGLTVITVIMILNIVKINNYNMQIKLYTNTSMQFSSKVLLDLAAEDDYNSDMPVNIVGNLAYNDNFTMSSCKPYDIYNKYTHGTIPGFVSGLKVSQLIHILGFDIIYDENLEYDEEYFELAPSFPEDGYIYEDNGGYIVKLGDTKGKEKDRRCNKNI